MKNEEENQREINNNKVTLINLTSKFEKQYQKLEEQGQILISVLQMFANLENKSAKLNPLRRKNRRKTMSREK